MSFTNDFADSHTLVLSISLNPASRSRLLAHEAAAALEALGAPHAYLDMRDEPVPFCGGGGVSGHPGVERLRASIGRASSLLLATPIYNYDASALAKNVIELTGRAWAGKPVGFLCAAGGKGSYMSVMGLANSLMLDFRCLIVPRFVYATKEAFTGDQLCEEVRGRIAELCATTIGLDRALRLIRTEQPAAA